MEANISRSHPVLLLKKSAALAPGLVVALWLQVLMSLILIFGTPTSATLIVELEESPMHQPGNPIHSCSSQFPQAKKLGCALMDSVAEGNPSINSSIANEKKRTTSTCALQCEESDASKLSDSEYPLIEIQKYFRENDAWEVLDVRISIRSGTLSELSWFVQILYLLVPILFAVIVLRKYPPEMGFRDSVMAISRRPWLLLMLPSAVFATAFVWQIFTSPESQEVKISLLDVFSSHGILLAVCFSLPIAEEAIFRQWLYKKAMQMSRPIVACITTSWLFTISHLFNFQTSLSLAYLLTIFVAGVTLFSIRYLSGSILVTIAAHIVSNSIFILSALYLNN